jgi:hypothetical protein
MRTARTALLCSLALLAGCKGEQAQEGQAATESPPAVSGATVYSSGPRDRLCLKDGRGGLIVYAATGNSNCSARGTVAREDGRLSLRPDGDSSCRIEIGEGPNGDSVVTLGELTPACAYYCGPKASYAGRTLTATGNAPATDLAGDPLC